MITLGINWKGKYFFFERFAMCTRNSIGNPGGKIPSIDQSIHRSRQTQASSDRETLLEPQIIPETSKLSRDYDYFEILPLANVQDCANLKLHCNNCRECNSFMRLQTFELTKISWSIAYQNNISLQCRNILHRHSLPAIANVRMPSTSEYVLSHRSTVGVSYHRPICNTTYSPTTKVQPSILFSRLHRYRCVSTDQLD